MPEDKEGLRIGQSWLIGMKEKKGGEDSFSFQQELCTDLVLQRICVWFREGKFYFSHESSLIWESEETASSQHGSHQGQLHIPVHWQAADTSVEANAHWRTNQDPGRKL